MLLQRHRDIREAEAAALRAHDHKNALILEERRAAAAVIARAAEAQVMTVASVFHSEKAVEAPPVVVEEAKVEETLPEPAKVEEAEVEADEKAADDAEEDADEVKVVKRGKKK